MLPLSIALVVLGGMAYDLARRWLARGKLEATQQLDANVQNLQRQLTALEQHVKQQSSRAELSKLSTR